MLGKGKEKEVADDIGASETTIQNNTFSASFPASNAMQLFGVPETLTGPSYAPNLYAMFALPMKASNEMAYAPLQLDYQCLKEAPTPWQQAKSNASLGNFAGESSNIKENCFSNYQSGFPESNFNSVTNTLAGASHSWENSVFQNQPNMALNHTGMNANEEGNETNKKANEDAGNEMIISPAPSVLVAYPSTSGVPNDSRDFFPAEDPFETIHPGPR